MPSRLDSLEKALGAPLPTDYTSFLAGHHAGDEAGLYVSSNPDYWGVRSLFELSSGAKHYQLDDVYRLVRDVIPIHSLPIADDWAGNLYLLICAGPSAGQVVWWNHEREPKDFTTEKVANSFPAFVELLARDET